MKFKRDWLVSNEGSIPKSSSAVPNHVVYQRYKYGVRSKDSSGFFDGSGGVDFMSAFKTFCTCIVLVVLIFAIIRLSNSSEPFTIEYILDYFESHFVSVSSWFRTLDLPVRIGWNNPSPSWAWLAGIWNSIVYTFSLFGYICSIMVNVIYTLVSVFVWILTGYVI